MSKETEKAYKAMYYLQHREKMRRDALAYYHRHKEERQEYAKQRYKGAKKRREEDVADQDES